MIAFANAKINLGLHITGKRPDGYHLLESVFVPIPLCDILELQPIQGQADRLKVLGNIATGDDADNLVIRAIRALRSRCDFPGVEVILKKQIPSGAGLGGGSADASTTLRMLRETFALEISDEDLEGIALSLGADCPFFVRNTPRLVEGIGEVFRPAPRLDIGHYNLVVVKPDLHVSTGEAFRGLSRIGGHAEHVSAIVASPIETWRGRLVNDFEASLFPTYPILAEIKSRLYDLGAVYASMTGSGSACFAFFERRLSPREQEAFEGMFLWQSINLDEDFRASLGLGF